MCSDRFIPSTPTPLFITIILLIILCFSPLTSSLTRADQITDPDQPLYSTAAACRIRTSLIQQLNDAENLALLATTLLKRALPYSSVMMMKNSAALRDCLELYDDTVYFLNRTLVSLATTSGAADDRELRTWLSAGLTNLGICEDGFAEVGVGPVPDMVLMVNANLSRFISKSLVTLGSDRYNDSSYKAAEVDAERVDEFEENVGGLPVWVSREDRNLLESSTRSFTEDGKAPYVIMVAKDGSGDYKTIKKALRAAAVMRKTTTGRLVIRIKSGVYKEYLEIDRELNNVMLVGDGRRKTIITGHRSVGGGYTTFGSATVAVRGNGFIARGITFRNTAGPRYHQAVALRSSSDQSVFYKCSFEGYQDTLYALSQRQFYRESDIYGTVDFIFGNAAAVFQGCHLYVRKPMPMQMNTATAQGRTDPNQNTGFVIHRSRITAAPQDSKALREDGEGVKTYLGRPWKKYSRTVVMRCRIDGVVDPAGWLEWDEDEDDLVLRSLYYAEYDNYGDGSGTNRRVDWPGYQIITTARQAGRFTVRRFIDGESWLPMTLVPFTGGM